ncbi:TRAP transporter substrate-binding protein [Pseudahrensia aquimaris]|uniref:TRAP transporter substrate-binding protein n=1 Tax=Pseudahrensia aquimaris TaxID=744461 RepID=A0ABW3FFQ1_9HYPH
MFRQMLVAGAVAAALMSSTSAFAQEVTLKMQHFLPAPATVPAKFLTPWAEKVEKESGGRIEIDIFPTMQLGGKPPQLYDQVKDGVVDLGWTLPGYTPGRFPSVEAFELPFMMTNAPATSKALMDYVEKHGADEFKDVKIIAMHVHGPGVIHAKGDGIRSLEDMAGKKLRGPTRVINNLLSEAGATPIGMPVPAVPEALSKGVIDGTVIPWEVTKALKVSELTNTHTEFGGDRALYTAVFVFAMNKAKYDAMPDDLKKVIDDNSGLMAAEWVGQVMWDADAPARKVAEDRKNAFVAIEGEELAKWQAAGQKVSDAWAAEMTEKGRDGAAMVNDAKMLIEKYSK